MDYKNNFLFVKLRQSFEIIESDMLNSIEDANILKNRVQHEFLKLEMKNSKNRSFYNDYDNNDDALMISEYNEEIPDMSMSAHNSQTNTPNGGASHLTGLDANNNTFAHGNEELLKLDESINSYTELSINSIDERLRRFFNQRFAKCSPELADACMGHIGFDDELGNKLVN